MTMDQNSKNLLGQSCESYCYINVHKNSSDSFSGGQSTCKREGNWTKGMRIQYMVRKLDELKKEISNGEVKVTPSGEKGGYCAPYAEAILKILKGTTAANGVVTNRGLLKVREELIGRYNVDKDALKTNEMQGCVDEGYSFVDPTNHQSQAEKLKAKALSDSYLGKQTKANTDINIGYCHLTYAQKNIEYLLKRLATCEILVRSKNEFYTYTLGTPSPMSSDLQTYVANPCKEAAKAAADKVKKKKKRAAAENAFNACYRSRIFPFYSTHPLKITQEESPPLFPSQQIVKFNKMKTYAGEEIQFPACEE
jgi:hypothetical protein